MNRGPKRFYFAVHPERLGRVARGAAEELRKRLRCEVVERLEPIIQRHDIEGLMM